MEKKQINATKMVVIVALGAALYGVGGLLSIPVFTNTSLKPAMAILALWSAAFGPVVGFLVGFIGHMLTDLFAGWGVWWTWVLGSGLVGIMLGCYKYLTKDNLEDGVFGAKEVVILIVLSLVANFLGYFVSAVLDYFIYTEPLNKVFVQQLIAASTNTVCIGVLGSVFMKLYANKKASGKDLE